MFFIEGKRITPNIFGNTPILCFACYSEMQLLYYIKRICYNSSAISRIEANYS